ncbi:hypothetical protein QBC43DRAFT_289224 [Cladorrhinum sp. PSN259]|nr:hypothetical protein QBC43DRAFT_289224 [Cladorrhinum sp. PSN259]
MSKVDNNFFLYDASRDLLAQLDEFQELVSEEDLTTQDFCRAAWDLAQNIQDSQGPTKQTVIITVLTLKMGLIKYEAEIIGTPICTDDVQSQIKTLHRILNNVGHRRAVYKQRQPKTCYPLGADQPGLDMAVHELNDLGTMLQGAIQDRIGMAKEIDVVPAVIAAVNKPHNNKMQEKVDAVTKERDIMAEQLAAMTNVRDSLAAELARMTEERNAAMARAAELKLGIKNLYDNTRF